MKVQLTIFTQFLLGIVQGKKKCKVSHE